MRARAYSPNHIGNDAAIFNFVAEQLRKRGCVVNVYSEEQFIADGVDESIVLDMCRDGRSIKRLQAMEDAGAIVINSGYGIENCIRERLARILKGSALPYPDTLVVNTDEGVRDQLRKAAIDACWIKRGDSHSRHKEDVCYVRHADEAQELLQEFFMRGIKRAVINRHLEGDLVKFYGVLGTNFFYWFYPMGRNGNSNEVHAAFDPEKLKQAVMRAADILDVVVFGGDCIVAPDGTFTIIDFNDWPSFGPCRQEAAPHIARAVITAIKEAKKD